MTVSPSSRDPNVFAQVLREECARLDLDVSKAQIQAFTAHYQLLLRWAPKVNLTTVLDAEEAAVRHAVDSLLFHHVLPSNAHPLADLGSGAGFPGIPIAIQRPERRVLLVEPIRKRCSFLRTVVAELDLGAVQVVEGRLESAGPLPRGLPAEGIVSRATWDPTVYAPLAARALLPGGHLVVSSGRGAPPVSELEAAGAGALVHAGRWEFELRGGLTRVLDLMHHPR